MDTKAFEGHIGAIRRSHFSDQEKIRDLEGKVDDFEDDIERLEHETTSLDGTMDGEMKMKILNAIHKACTLEEIEAMAQPFKDRMPFATVILPVH